MDVKAVSPSQGNDYKKEMMTWEMQQILDKLKGKHNLKKISYVYLIMLLSEFGIAKQSAVIKVIAKVQEILGKVIGDINKLEQLLEEIEHRGFGGTNIPGTLGHWILNQQGQRIGWQAGKPPVNKPWDPTKHSASENNDQMEKQIEKWLQEKSDIKGPDGKPLTNLGALRYIWKDLYGTGKNGNDGLMGQLKDALENPIYKQHLGSGYNEIMGWNGSGSPLAGHNWNWSRGGVWQRSFLGFLQGKPSHDGYTDYVSIAKDIAAAFCSSYYNKTGTSPKGSTAKYDDTVGNLISQNFEIGKQTENGLNSTESADLSMTSQNLMSLIQITEKIIQLVASEIQHTTSKMGQS